MENNEDKKKKIKKDPPHDSLSVQLALNETEDMALSAQQKQNPLSAQHALSARSNKTEHLKREESIKHVIHWH